MKKTLIALAAVAVTSTAMAQVTISGEAGFGYDSDTTAGVTASGLEQTDGSVTIAVTEDLGGGMKLSASHTIDLKGRKSVNAENSSLSLTGGFGTLTMGAVEFGNGILGLGSAGAPLRGLDNGVALDPVANADFIQYTTPALIPGLTANVVSADSVGAGAVGAGEGDLQITGFGVNYAAGPLTIAADTTSYNYTAAAAASQANNRTRLSASYNLGVAKIGAGYQKKTYLLTGKPNKQTVVGVNVPMGAISFGAAMSTNKTDGGVKTKGTDAGVAYSLSKRTTISFARMSTKVGTASSNSMTRLDLVHKF